MAERDFDAEFWNTVKFEVAKDDFVRLWVSKIVGNSSLSIDYLTVQPIAYYIERTYGLRPGQRKEVLEVCELGLAMEVGDG